MAASTKPTPNNDITVTQALPVSGGASPPTTPGAGLGAFYGRGTSNLTPGFKNEGGTDQTIMTDQGNAASSLTAAVATNQSTTSATYTDLATSGPAVTVTIGAKGAALVSVGGLIYTNTGTGDAYMGFAVSGGTTVAAADASAASNIATAGQSMSRLILVTGLNAGSNTFTAKYRVVSGTGNFVNRNIVVLPL